MATSPRVDANALIEFGAAVYAGAGMPEVDAHLVADTLVQADLWGHQSHGVLRLGWYLDRIRNGVMKPVTKPEFVVDAGTVAVIDGHDGVGHVVTELATREAIKRAKAHGLGAVGVRMSNHFGTCMYYTRLGTLEGCAMFLTSNGGPAMAPWGGRKKIIGTNPFSVATPAGKYPPFLMDMANTGVARGKIYLARNRRQPIPEGWAIDKDGKPTTDARAALEGSMLPAGGVKGAMLALTVELLVCALSGAAYGFESDSFFSEEGKPTRIGQAFLAVNPAALAGENVFFERVETLVAAMTQDPGVRLPGARRLANRELAGREGVSVPADLLAKIRELAGEPSAARQAAGE
jgi:LDH2 family malate/lactate/ureidoglycolate dehydrogenase